MAGFLPNKKLYFYHQLPTAAICFHWSQMQVGEQAPIRPLIATSRLAAAPPPPLENGKKEISSSPAMQRQNTEFPVTNKPTVIMTPSFWALGDYIGRCST